MQSCSRQLAVETVSGRRLEAFLRIYRMNPELRPEPGATCSNPAFADDPLPPAS